MSLQRQLPIALDYKGLAVECSFRVDLVVDRAVIVEVKAIVKVLPVHEAQLLTYLKLTGCRVGLLLNFNVPLLRNGIRRLILG